MSSAISLSAISMANDMRELDLIGNNLANANTNGYKRDLLAQGFEKAVNSNMAALSGMPQVQITDTTPVVTAHPDLSPGALKDTANPLDVAIEGNGYFKLMGPDGPVYTRLGAFAEDASGRLVGTNGYPVVGDQGDILLSGGKVTITPTGEVQEDGEPAGQLSLVTFSNPAELVKHGHSTFVAPKGVEEMSASNARVREGYLEASNVNAMDEMVHLMSTMRHFEMVSKVLKGQDDMIGTAVSSIAQF